MTQTVTIPQIEKAIRQLKSIHKYNKTVKKIERANRIQSADSYTVQIFFYEHIQKKLGMLADTAELVDIEQVELLFNHRMVNNAGIKKIRVYYNEKPFRSVNFLHNEEANINCSHITLL